MKTAKLLVILSTPVLLLLLESFMLWPRFLIGAELVAVFWIIFLVRFLARQSSLGKKWWLHALLPGLLFLSLSFCGAILVNQWLIQIVFLFLLIFLARYFNVLYGFFVKNDLKQIERLPNFSLSGGLLLVFVSISDIYSLQVFVSWSTWAIFGLSILFLLLITYHNWQICQLNIKNNLSLYLIVNLLLLQTIAILFFWPFNYQVLALVVTLIYYVLINCTRLYLSASLTKEKVRLYLLFSGLAFIFLILSARWL